VNAIFDRITATANNQIGIAIVSSNVSGTTSVSLTNSIASNNGADGISAFSESAATGVLIDNVDASSNSVGIFGNGTAKVVLGRSVVTNNSNYGIDNQTAPTTFYTYQNNEIYLNGHSNALGGSSPTNVTYQ
jgi:hypothetical protein